MTFEMGICLWTQASDWADTLHAAETVDALGFDHLWTIDHWLAPQGDPEQAILDGWSVLMAWAARTKAARLGLFVGANTFRSPTQTAKLATTLDHISGGRAIVGLGAGWHVREHAAYGVEFGSSVGERIGWLDESADIVRRLLDGETVTATDGRYRAEALRLLPPPVQAHVPMMIGGSGPKRTLRAVARHADMWNGFGWPEEIERTVGFLHGHCEAIGRDPGEIRLTVGSNVIIRERREDAERVLATQLAANATTPENDNMSPHSTWLMSADELVETLGRYIDLGIRGLIVEMAAPHDLETFDVLATEVRPRMDEYLASKVG